MDTELAWAAGFFEGEGCVSCARTHGRLRIRAAVTQNGDSGPLLLQRFVEAVGIGKVLGPYDYSNNGLGTKPRYVVQYQSVKDVTLLIMALHPYMTKGSPKLARYFELAAEARREKGGERTS